MSIQFNTYESVLPPKKLELNDILTSTYDQLYNNLFNIIERKKSSSVPKNSYVEKPKDEEETKDKVLEQETKKRIPWVDNYLGNNYTFFKNNFEQSLQKHPEYNTDEWRQFYTDLAFAESSFKGDSINQIGAKGYFQLMPSNVTFEWNNSVDQFYDMYKLTDSNIKYFDRNMTPADYQRMKELGIDEYGLLAGAHLGGAKNALKTLRGESNKKDANGTSIMSYFRRFTQTK